MEGAGVAQSVYCLTAHWTTWVQCPAEANYFSCRLCVQTSSEDHPASCTMGIGDPFPSFKGWPGRDADHLLPCSAEYGNNKQLYLLSPQASAWRVVRQLQLLALCPEQLWVPLSLLANGYLVSIRWSKTRAGRESDHPVEAIRLSLCAFSMSPSWESNISQLIKKLSAFYGTWRLGAYFFLIYLINYALPVTQTILRWVQGW
jgi:hypothetical protein